MSRTIKDLEMSRARVSRAIEFLQTELVEIEKELASLNRPATLDDDFFWKELAPILLDRENGIRSSDLQVLFKKSGIDIEAGRLRTFLSRQKAKGHLKLKLMNTGTVNWALSNKAKDNIASETDE